MISREKLVKSAADEEEKLLISKAVDRANTAIKTFTPEFTVFMDTYKAHSIHSLFKHEGDVQAVIYGGYEDSERLKIGFFPEYTEPDTSLFPISPVEISYNSGFSGMLTHREYLGSVLGLGITREKIGDILPEEGRAVLFADSDIAEYIAANLERVGRTKVRAKLVSDIEIKPKEAVEKRLTVPSLRLDALLSSAFNISRGKAAELIKGEKAFINWKQISSVSRTINEGDIVTLRGYGRVKLTQVVGTTKKDRILLRLIIYK